MVPADRCLRSLLPNIEGPVVAAYNWKRLIVYHLDRCWPSYLSKAVPAVKFDCLFCVTLSQIKQLGFDARFGNLYLSVSDQPYFSSLNHAMETFHCKVYRKKLPVVSSVFVFGRVPAAGWALRFPRKGSTLFAQLSVAILDKLQCSLPITNRALTWDGPGMRAIFFKGFN